MPLRMIIHHGGSHGTRGRVNSGYGGYWPIARVLGTADSGCCGKGTRSCGSLDDLSHTGHTPHHFSPSLSATCDLNQSSFSSSPNPGPSGTGKTLFRTTGVLPCAIFSLLPRNAPSAFSTLK